MLYSAGSGVAVGVELGSEVLVGVNVGASVQVAGSSDIAVAFGTISVADNWGGGAGLSRSQDEVKMITIENKIIRTSFFIIFPKRICCFGKSNIGFI